MSASKYSQEVQKTFQFLSDVHGHRERVGETDGVAPSWVKVTTITMLSNLKQRLAPETIRAYFNDYKYVRLTKRGCRRFKGRGQDTKFAWRLSNTTFYNQVTIRYEDYKSTKSVKIFPNGSIQVAGATDLIDCKDILKQLCVIMSAIFRKKFDVSNYSIAMINTNFSLNRSLNLRNIYKVFSETGMQTDFNPDRYSAVKIKVQPTPQSKRVTVSIFRTGKVIMTGAEKLEEIAMTYGKVMDILYSSTYKVFHAVAQNPEYFDKYRGWPIPELVRKLYSDGIVKNNVRALRNV